MKRYLDEPALKDWAGKMVVLTGPRQVGKTTLARMIRKIAVVVSRYGLAGGGFAAGVTAHLAPNCEIAAFLW